MRKKLSPTTITTNEQTTYFLITEQEALAEMKNKINEVNEILHLPATLVRLILDHYRWDKDKLIEHFYEDSDRIFKKLNVANPDLSPSLQWDPVSPACNSTFGSVFAAEQQPVNSGFKICRTCCVEQPSDQFFPLRCRHQHCSSCLQSYVETSISRIGYEESISCPSRCNQIIDDEEIFKLLSNNSKLYSIYQKALLKAFVSTNRLTNWCPGNGCSLIVKIKTHSPNYAPLIECDECQTAFCFRCLKQWHEPVECTVLQKWEDKNKDESMTGKWILANTKECPKCHSSIEKNGGCNHMTCRKPGCGHEFCWICFGDWRQHATVQCNVYRQEDWEKSQSEAREILARYMHYFTRYQTHNQSLELEDKLLVEIDKRIKEMQAEAMSYNDQQAIRTAFSVLKRCRRILKYTYPFAYYLKRSNIAEIFEQNQADLERATEILSGFLEREIDPKHETILRLMDTTSYCDRRGTILIDHCKDGYSKNYWEGLETN